MLSYQDNYIHENETDNITENENTDNRPRLECKFCKIIVLKHNLKNHQNTKKCKSFQNNLELNQNTIIYPPIE